MVCSCGFDFSIPSNVAPVAGGVIAFHGTQRLQGGRAQLAFSLYQSAPADGTRPQGHHNREQIASSKKETVVY